jgi:serine/threonine protein kinase/WD40 repeat protein/tetratricopeptide (TPR) repeat protein
VNAPESAHARDPLDRLAESFLARFRRGERPSLEEYAAANPELADDIRDLFPALVEIEQLKTPEQQPAIIDRKGRPKFSKLGDYQIGVQIGEGGMGVVYEAVRESLRSRVALKVMHERFRTRSDYVRRFLNEARSAAQLHHTNIVSVFDYGEHDGVYYYAMQYIAGHGMDRVLADVRRLRSNPGQVKVGPAEIGPITNEEGDRRSPRSLRDPAQARAATDPLIEAVTHGLITGHFAPAVGLAPDTAVPEPTTCEPTALGRSARTPASGECGFELGRPQVPPDLVDDPDSADSSSPSSLAGRGEVHYNREVARLGAQVADALAYAHKRGVLHRDIKPSNLLLDAGGNVWVTDFGLAKFEEGEDLSQSQDVVGTWRYMAPERFRGVSDRRCDIYALGATLYELLTLRPVFDSDDRLQLIDQVVHEAPVPPRQLDRRIPRDLETIVLKALAKDPNDRFGKADELAEELRRFLENRPILSRPTSAPERLWRSCKRNPVVAALIAVTAALTAFIAIGSSVVAWTLFWQRNELRFEQGLTKAGLIRAEHAEQETRHALGESEASLARAEAAKREARLALGQSLVSEGSALQRTGLVGQRFDSLDRLGKAAQVLGADPEGRKRLPDIRNRAIAALGLTDLRVRRQQDYGTLGINFDAALERYAVVERSGAVVLRRLDDDRVLAHLSGPDRRVLGNGYPDFSPDGELLVAVYNQGGGNNLHQIWDLGSRELLGSVPGLGIRAFHPDGRRLLFGALEGGIGVWDRVERRMIRRLPLDFAPNHLKLDPEGRRLAVNNTDWEKPRVAILELETGRVLTKWRSQVGSGAMAWSADGQLLAVGGGGHDFRVYVWNVRRGELASVLRGHNGMIAHAQFAHVGFLLATASHDGTTRFWDAASGEPLALVPGKFLGFASDDRQLALRAIGGKIGVWDVAPGAECRTLHPGMLGNRSEARDTTGVISADVSHDGRLLATSDEDGVRLWEPAMGRELAHLKAGFCESVLFHPDRQSLISSSRWGLYRWPIRPDPDRGPDAIRIGPPELVRESSGSGWGKAVWMPDHRTLAQIDNANARVLLVDSSHPHPAWSRATELDSGGNRRMTSVGVSPDGRWLAVGGWYEAGVRVWDLRRRRLERNLRPKDALSFTKFFIGFSPDGRWLVSCTTPDTEKLSYHFWCLGTWEPGLQIDHERSGIADYPPAFSGDGRLMALGIAPDQVLLADAATGRELARLTTLQPVTPTPLAFSPDGTKLVASTHQRTALVWDLRRIRDQLAPRGLNWDAPPYPTASAVSEASGLVPPPRSVRVIGEVIETKARRAAELAEMNRRLTANPDDAEALIHRGWLFHLEKKWPDAIADLERWLRLRPDDTDALFLLAQAYGQTNNLPAARTTLERYLVRSSEDIDARAMRGEVSFRLGRLQEAADDSTKVLAADPGRDPVRYRRAQIWLRLGRFPEALADLAPLIQRDPQNPALYDLRSQVHDRLGHREQALADMKHAVAFPLANAQYYNKLAWRLATGPVASRDPEQALVLARKAVALTPGSVLYLNTLGVAQYRNGQDGEAIATLERSLATGKGQFDAFDLFFLAMARHRLGQIAQAGADFDRAVRWRREHPNLAHDWSEELDRFRAEAETVLAGPILELPADVFAPE